MKITFKELRQTLPPFLQKGTAHLTRRELDTLAARLLLHGRALRRLLKLADQLCPVKKKKEKTV